MAKEARAGTRTQTRSEQPENHPPQQKKWTVMVYMVADKDTDLDAVAVHDLREMERGANGHAHVVVQMKRAWPVHPQRYEICSRKSVQCGDYRTDPNMADGKTLKGFLTWAVNKFQASHYCLVLWGHAYGLGFGRQHNDSLTLHEIKTALDAFSGARKSGEKLELLGANACAMAYAEAAYELRDSAHFMVASQLAVPYAGWPYETILRGVTGDTKPEDLGRLIAETYVNFHNSLPSGEGASMSLLNLKAASGLGPALAKLADSLTAAMAPEGRFSSDRQAMLRDVFLAAAAGDVRPLLDLNDLCRDLEDHCRVRKGEEFERVTTAARKVRNVLADVVLFPGPHTQHGHDTSLDDLHGLGIYAPFVTDDVDLERLQLGDEGRDAYRKLSIFQIVGEQSTTQEAPGDVINGAAWPELVYERLRREIDADLFESLSGIDATYHEDRRNAVQIALAIDASFNKFDRAAGEARKAAVEPMKQAGNAAAEAEATDASKRQRSDRRRLKLLRLQTSSPPRQQAHSSAIPNGNPSSAGVYTEAETSPKQELTVRPGSANHAGDQERLRSLVPQFQSLEDALGEVERAVLRGLTHEKLGLGPVAGNGLGEPPKTAELGPEPPKPATLGPEPPKPATLGDGVPGPASARLFLGGDLRFDLAVARVAALFGEVGSALAALERVTASVETNVVALFDAGWSDDGDAAASAKDLEREFSILHDASSSARRTVRRVLLHPVYGLGPGTTIGRSERQALARAGGLDRLSLQLM